ALATPRYGQKSVTIDVPSRYLFVLFSASSPSGLLSIQRAHTALPMLVAATSPTMPVPSSGRIHRGRAGGGAVVGSVILVRLGGSAVGAVTPPRRLLHATGASWPPRVPRARPRGIAC